MRKDACIGMSWYSYIWLDHECEQKSRELNPTLGEQLVEKSA